MRTALRPAVMAFLFGLGAAACHFQDPIVPTERAAPVFRNGLAEPAMNSLPIPAIPPDTAATPVWGGYIGGGG